MKILQVIPTLNPASGGPVEGLTQQGIVMTQMGHEVHTLCLDSPGGEVDPRLASSAVYMLGPSYLTYSFAPRMEPWLRDHAKEFDVLIVHGIWTYHGYCAAKVCRELGVPYVMFLHGMLDPWFARQYPLKHAKKWLYWPWAEYRNIRDARFVLFTTQEELRLARDSFWLYKARERLVGYGIAGRPSPIGSARDAFVARFPEVDGKRCLLYLSRVHPKKGCDLLVKAFAKHAANHPDLHLIIAGPGDATYLEMLQQLAKAKGVSSRITFTGMVKGELKWGAYDCADVFVLPSHQENFGIVVAEALASALPVLTTYQVNIWREIHEAGAGIIHADTESGAEKMISDWLAMSDEARREMRGRAAECFHRHFHVEKVTANLVQALEDAVQSSMTRHTYEGSLLNREVTSR